MTSENCKECGGTGWDSNVPFLDCMACSSDDVGAVIAEDAAERRAVFAKNAQLGHTHAKMYSVLGIVMRPAEKVCAALLQRDQPRLAYRQKMASIVSEMEARCEALQLLLNDRDEKLDALEAEAAAAILTLQGKGYTYHGGQLWKPPIGKKPDFNLVDTLREQLAERDSMLRHFASCAVVFQVGTSAMDYVAALPASTETAAEVMCRGDKALGTACGSCKRCKARDV